MADLPHGTVTFLFTDIEGSTRLWEHFAEAMPNAYARHDAILREAVGSYGGTVYKTIGDAVQAAFSTAPDAIAAAAHAQRALAAEAWPMPEPLRVRMGLHACAATLQPDGDYRTPGLNRLGRLMSAGHGGQIILTAAIAELIRGSVPPGLDVIDLGEHRLRDLQPERIYQLTAPGIPHGFPPLVSLDTHPNNLPSQLTPFIGRERELAATGALVTRHDVRLLTLTGPGGTGKTRLGLQLAASTGHHFPDGVHFVPLAPITDPALVLSAVATALGAQETPDQPLLDAVAASVGTGRVLLVLDNFEQVRDAAPTVSHLLSACPNLTVLVTSRGRIGVYGEHEFPVPPFTLPDPGQPTTVAALTQYESVRLFIDRARAALPAFAVTNANAPAVAEICVRLDGLPLAIELAAARIRMLPPEALLRRLTTRLPLLTGGARDLPARHRTLRGTIAWSHELLTPDEQALFRRLAVFPASCDLDAVEVVAAGDLDLTAIDGVERLLDHNLVFRGTADGEPRFTMLETIREYGLEQLEAHGEAAACRHRLAHHVVSQAERILPDLRTGARRDSWMEQMDRDHAAIRASLEWALHHDRVLALRLMAVAAIFWINHGYLREAEAWFDRGLPHAGLAPPDVQGRLLRSASNVAWHRGAYERATVLAQESLAQWRLAGDPWEIADSINELAVATAEHGDLPRAVAYLDEARAMFRALNDTYRLTWVEGNLGNAMHILGDLDGAAAVHRSNLVTLRELGNDVDMTYCLCNLADVTFDQGDAAAAEAMYREALALLSPASERRAYLGTIQGLASAMAMNGRPAAGVRLLGAVESMLGDIGAILEQGERDRATRARDRIRDMMGTTAFDAALLEGHAMPLDQLLAMVDG